MRLLLLLLVLPSLAAAEAPFDLVELRAEHPGDDLVVFEQTLVAKLDGEVLRLTETRRVALLQETAREDLAMFTTQHLPGCRVPTTVDISVTSRRGDVQAFTAEDLLRVVERPHPSDPDLSSEEWKFPRRGLGAGSLLEERLVVDYPLGCWKGFAGTHRTLGSPSGPVLSERVVTHEGVFAALDRDVSAGWKTVDRTEVFERVDVPAPASEDGAPRSTLPRVYLATSDDPRQLALNLAPALKEAGAAARGKVAAYAKDAKDDFKGIRDPGRKMGRYLYSLPSLGDETGVFGAQFGDVPKSGTRVLTPMEWWALATAALEPHGGVPVLFDPDCHLPPPDGVAAVDNFVRVGVLLDDLFVTRESVHTLDGGTAPELADRWFLTVGPEPELRSFQARPDHSVHRWSGVVDLTAGDYTRLDLKVTHVGDVGREQRERRERQLANWKGKKSAEKSRDRSFVKGALRFGDLSVGTLELPRGEEATTTMHATYSRPSEILRGEGVAALTVRLPWDTAAAGLVLEEARTQPIELQVIDREIDLVFRTPDGMTLAGLPDGGSAVDGPLAVEVAWEEVAEGARLTIRYRVEERYLNPELTGVTNEAAELLRKARAPTLLYLTDS